jgi:hypothetical protein
MKTYVITVSRYFPVTHPRKGEETYFVEKIDNAIGATKCCNVGIYSPIGYVNIWPKIHTIRANYPFWEKRINEINEGKAVLSIRYWSGKPYNSKQVEICQLDKDSGIGLQRLNSADWILPKKRINNLAVWGHSLGKIIKVDELAKNDGLSIEDFKAWFKGYDLSKPMAIIHFTNFRY